MNFLEAANNAINELNYNMTASYHQAINEPRWFVVFTDRNTDTIYLSTEITWDGGIVASVMDFAGMDHKRKAKIMNAFLKYLEPPANNMPPLYECDAIR